MKDYNINVNFQDGSIESNFMELVQNDYNTTTLKFKFDTDNRVVFKMLYPDNETEYVVDIEDNQLILGPGILSQDGLYRVELASYPTDGRVTAYATMEFYVRKELVNTDEIVEPDDRVPILDNLINEVDNINISATKEDDVATIIVTKKDGTTETVEVYDGEIGPQGEQGPKGDKGDTGAQGPQGIQGPKGDTGPQGIQGPKGDKGDTGSQGAVGPAGATGPQGPKGDKGDKGDTGSQGPTGPQGPKGDKGDPGLTQQEVQDLIDASIEELGELGFTPTVVQTLPVTDIDTHTIYLVPKTGETGDVYDEYIYINNAWEHIGSTAVDLSNYYTKSEVDTALSTKTPYYTLNLTTVVSEAKVNLNQSDMEALSSILTDAYSSGYTAINILMNATYNDGKKLQVLLMPSIKQTDLQNKPTRYEFQYFCTEGYVAYPGDQQYYTLLFGWVNVYSISWDSDICTVAGAQFNGTRNAVPTNTGVLLKNNIFSYTPTRDYNPATKKYVDDSIAAIPSSSYTAGEGIDITNNEISSTMPIYTVDTATYADPFIIEGKPLGLYLFKHISTPYLSGYSGGNKQYIQLYNGFVLLTNTTIDHNSATYQQVGYVWGSQIDSTYGNIGNYSGTLSVYGTTGKTLVGNSSNTFAVPASGNSSISGIKTFSTLPESSAVPTTNNQLVNKKYVDDLVSSSTEDKLHTYVFDMDDTFYNDTASYHTLTSTEKQRLADILNDAYTKGYSSISVLVNYKNGSTSSEYIDQALCFNMYDNAHGILTKPTYIHFISSPTSLNFATSYTDRTYYDFVMPGLQISLTWSGDTCTVSSGNFQGRKISLATTYALTNYLTKNNTSTYSPTGDYNPATKKYVDTAIASAITDALGGSY